MIKETVDAVRVAEMEAEKQIATAKENADGEKARMKTMEADYRAEQMQMAKMKAEQAMREVVKQCSAYDLEKDKQIEDKVAELKTLSGEKESAAIEAVMDALV